MPVADTTDREIVLTRVFDAPRDLVFDAWTSPEHLAQWWGPRGFTTTTHEFDMRPGGTWRLTMHGPDGVDYRNRMVFLEIARPERLVYKHEPEKGTEPVNFQVTVAFVEQGERTELTMRMVFPSAAQREHVATKYGAIEGGKQTLERLGEHVAKVAAESKFVYTRVFDAPRDLVWKAFTEPERLKRWWGPKGFTVLAANVDLRLGGIFHYGLRSPDSHVMWGKWVYREIVAPERLASVVSFTDEEGNAVRHPMAPTWPLEVLHTMTLSEHEGKTTLTVFAVPINATEEERKTFGAGIDGMEKGFRGTLDQLTAYLAEVKA